jgi:glycosyltransferase involved in cell wall biosynthesis
VTPQVSLICPAYNAGKFIEDNLRTIVATLERLERPFEIFLVCDGSTDGTAAAARNIDDPRVIVLSYELNQGKGNAICHALPHARGRLVGWLDPDLDIDPEVILRAVQAFEEEPVDAVIGSKRADDSHVHYPAIRRVYSWGFQTLVRLMFRVNVRDTQVGAKLFRREMLDTVGPLLLIKRYAFDLEVIAVGAEFGFDRVREIPIRLEYRFTGTGINWRAVKHMVQDTLAIAYRIHLRHWYVRRFASLQRRRMDESAGIGEREPLAAPEPATAAAP